MNQFMQPPILLLKEGTDQSQGRAQVISNINACAVVVEIVKTTLGPRGMDKLVVTGASENSKVTISNDGATIMKLLDIVHPAAKVLVDIAKSQDAEVGDGTTSVVVLAGELLKEAKSFVEDGVHSQIIIKGFRVACELAKKRIKELHVTFSEEEKRNLMEKCAATALNSKLVSSHGTFFAKMITDAVMKLDDDLNIDLVGIKKEPGGSLGDSFLVDGVAFKKTFSYAGFEQQPKKFENPKIICLNIELELKKEKENAEIRIEDPTAYQSIVDAEWTIIYEKLDNIIKSGAKVVLSRLAIGDLATQYFADRGIFCAGRVADDDMRRVCKATGAAVQTTVNNIVPSVLGECKIFEERQIGGQRYNFFTGCDKAVTATIILRGGGEQFVDEAERSIHDAVMIVRRARKHNAVVAGGGAIEMELSKYLREYARTIQGKQQLIISAFAKALEVIPRQVAANAGFDSTDILNLLRQKHFQPDGSGKWFGVDVNNEGICDTYEKFVWEPSLVKLNSITAASEAACLILSIDETVKNAESEKPSADPLPGPRPGGRGRGRGMPGRRQ